MIVYIHGFGSCGWGEKSLTLRRYFGIDQMLAPDLPFHPEQAVAHLRDLIARHPVSALIGSSLGGFYATWLNAAQALPTVLINPVVRPQELLRAYLGPQRRWCDGSPFLVDDHYLQALLRLQRDRPGADEPYLVMLQQGDEVLDYRQAASFYRGKDIVQLPGGSHRFENLDHHLPEIANWLSLCDANYAQAIKTAP